MNNVLPTLALPLLAALVAPAKATTIVNIDASVTGCQTISLCDGNPHLPPGSYVGPLINPVQVSLAAGSYDITNASGQFGANGSFTAWRFDGGNDWVWSFEIIDDATKTIVVQGCCGSAVYGSQAAAAADPFAVNYHTTLTLPRTTTLDFITEDWYPYDNAGGVALAISAVPEPAAPALMLGGLIAMALRLRRRAVRDATQREPGFR